MNRDERAVNAIKKAIDSCKSARISKRQSRVEAFNLNASNSAGDEREHIQDTAPSQPQSVNAFGARLGSTRHVKTEVRMWISMEDINWDAQIQGTRYHQQCIEWRNDPDVCVERVLPRLERKQDVSYALKDMKGDQGHSSYTHSSGVRTYGANTPAHQPELVSLSLPGLNRSGGLLGSYK